MSSINLSSKIREGAPCSNCGHLVICLSGKWIRLNTPIICDNCGIKLKVKDRNSTGNLVIMLGVIFIDVLVVLSTEIFYLGAVLSGVLLVSIIITTALALKLLVKRRMDKGAIYLIRAGGTGRASHFNK